jgi:hypothetical protein
MSILRNVAVGAIAGFGASWVMNQFQERAAPSIVKLVSGKEPSFSSSQEDPLTVKVAQRIYRRAKDEELPAERKELAGQLVHYLMGTATGAVFGFACSLYPKTASGNGTLYGAAVWLFGDELGTFLSGLSKPPTEYPLSTHAYGLLSHLVYGLSLGLLYSYSLKRSLSASSGLNWPSDTARKMVSLASRKSIA